MPSLQEDDRTLFIGRLRHYLRFQCPQFADREPFVHRHARHGERSGNKSIGNAAAEMRHSGNGNYRNHAARRPDGRVRPLPAEP